MLPVTVCALISPVLPGTGVHAPPEFWYKFALSGVPNGSVAGLYRRVSVAGAPRVRPTGRIVHNPPAAARTVGGASGAMSMMIRVEDGRAPAGTTSFTAPS